MSSVFLYVAIVGIWAFVLVPRWLRREHPVAQPDTGADVGDEAGEGWGADAAWPQDGPEGTENGDDVADPAGREPSWPESAPYEPAGQPTFVPARARVLRARRRLLSMIALLTLAALACTALKLTSWWTCIPPIGMLGMYLLLLREAALADAEQARRRAAEELRDAAARQRAHQPEPVFEDEPSAQVIDISARVSDQFYDQYADAAVRAVGD